MKKLMENFSGDYRVMRVIFSTSDPLKTLIALDSTISYRSFIRYLEMLDAKATIEEDAINREKQKAKREQEKNK